jgi:hypothetical protein
MVCLLGTWGHCHGHAHGVSENSEGGDPWEEFSRLGRGGSLPPRGRGIARGYLGRRGGGPSPLLEGGVEGWCYGYGQVLLL